MSASGRALADTLRGTGGRFVVACAIVAVYCLLAYGIHAIFTARIPSGNDFYPRWQGTRALIVEGKDPYSEQVTLEIQNAMYGRPAREDEDQVAFAYPLYVSLLILPYSLLPYPLAQAFWISTLVLTLLATLLLILRTLGWVLPPPQLAGIALWAVLFYPSARSLVLGQLSIFVLALLALSLWAMQRGRPFLAGCALALSTIKPQMVFLVVPFMLLSAPRGKRHRTLGGFVAAMASLLAVTSIVLPTWIPSFLAGLTSYESYTSIYREGRSPLGVLLTYLFPSVADSILVPAISIGVLTALVCVWIVPLKRPDIWWHAFTLTIILSLILPAQTGTTNQVLLLLPIVYLLARWSAGRAMRLLLSLTLLVVPWALFILTFFVRSGEHAIMSIVLPLFTLVLLWPMPRETPDWVTVGIATRSP
jgi:hypothetical protein